MKKERKVCISHEWIYQHVLADKQAGGDLYRHLRCQKKRRKRYGKYDRRGKLPNCRSIEERLASLNARKPLVDWEVDTLLGRPQKHAILTLAERKSRFTLLGKVSRRTAQIVRQQICKLLLPVRDKAHTLTSDHGKELADLELIAEKLQPNSISLIPTPLGNAAWMKTRMVCCDNTFPRSQTSRLSPTKRWIKPCRD